ncbi:MAG: hypothetical protein AB7O49_13405 [Sphingomonadales bacterium]
MPVGRLAALAIALLLASCGPDYEEVVVGECVRDGESRRYCECQADGMKQALGVERYGVFTDFILLGGTGKATRDDVLRLMERHELAPEELAEAQAAINDAMPLVHAYCAR